MVDDKEEKQQLELLSARGLLDITYPLSILREQGVHTLTGVINPYLGRILFSEQHVPQKTCPQLLQNKQSTREN